MIAAYYDVNKYYHEVRMTTMYLSTAKPWLWCVIFICSSLAQVSTYCEIH